MLTNLCLLIRLAKPRTLVCISPKNRFVGLVKLVYVKTFMSHNSTQYSVLNHVVAQLGNRRRPFSSVSNCTACEPAALTLLLS